MSRVVSPEAMRAIEHIAMADGVSEPDLIFTAASSIARRIDSMFPSNVSRPRTLVAVVGPGNNGTDAAVAGSILAEQGWDVSVRLVGRESLDNIDVHGRTFDGLTQVAAVQAADVILDGIFGNSGRTTLPNEATTALREIASIQTGSNAYVIAVDCPTGTNTETGAVSEDIVGANLTLCISDVKVGMFKSPAVEHLGEIEIIDIGLRDRDVAEGVFARLADSKYAASITRSRSVVAHKSDIGGLLVVGGGPSYFGAPRLAGEAALRSGCGYVGLAAPRSIIGPIASAVPELIFHPTSDGDGRRSAAAVHEALSESDRYNAVVIGPGLGRDEVADEFLAHLFQKVAVPESSERPVSPFGIPRRVEADSESPATELASLPTVLDADALNWLAEQKDWTRLLNDRVCVLTPHAGEMARLLDTTAEEVAEDPWGIAVDAAASWQQTVVLKAGVTCVATPDGDLFVSPRPTPELATPGSGDVLAGMIGAFLAQGHSPLEASILGIYVGATAGHRARFAVGTTSVIARDIISGISEALRDIDPVVRGNAKPNR